MKRKLAILGAILLVAFIFTYEGNTYQAHALDEEDLAWIAEAGQALRQIVEDREVMALVYLCDEYKLHSDASEDSAAVVTVPSGQMVEILDVTVDEDGPGLGKSVHGHERYRLHRICPQRLPGVLR